MQSDESIEQERKRLLEEIAILKRDKPNKWQRDVKRKVGRLWHLDRPDVYEASEIRGRKAVRSMGFEPQHDDFGDQSYP